MTIYKDSSMETLYYSDEPTEYCPCVVKIEGQEILVEWDSNSNGVIQYLGHDLGHGHYKLESNKIDGRASLHMFPDPSILEGYWVERNQRGMWRIKLA